MATTNYGLPQFNGEFATQPIQFRTTITDGFNKIDEVMKQNEEAAAPVAEMQTELTNIQTSLNAMKTYSNVFPDFVKENNNIFNARNLTGIRNDGVYSSFLLYYRTIANTAAPTGSHLGHFNGNPFNISGVVGYTVTLTKYNNAGLIQDETIARVDLVYDSQTDQTVLSTSFNITATEGITFIIGGELSIRNP